MDLIVLTSTYSQESLKRLLVESDYSFYLVDPKNKQATYKVLWCTIGLHRCKVDILIPGTLNIPHILPQHIEHIGRLPVIPLVPLVLLKLQGWTDHRDSSKPWERLKEPVDLADVKEILAIACRRGRMMNLQTKNTINAMTTTPAITPPIMGPIGVFGLLASWPGSEPICTQFVDAQALQD